MSNTVTIRLSKELAAWLEQASKRSGIELVYQIDGDRVILSNAQENKIEDDPFRAFGEWDSEANGKAYAKL